MAGFKNAKAFSEKHGIANSTYGAHENGSRGINADVLEHYANLLGVPVACFWDDEVDLDYVKRAQTIITEGQAEVEVVGVAAAGVWQEVAQGPMIPDETEKIPVMKDPKLADFRHFAVKVEGQSMNRVIKDGEYAICIDPWSVGGFEPRDGDIVVVERSRFQGAEKEVTIKRVVQHGAALACDSTDPRYQGVIALDPGDDPEASVSIVGLVRSIWRPIS